MIKVLFSTTNKHKIKEANETGKIYGIEFEQINFPYPEIRDEKFENIASDGVKYVYEKIKRPVIVDDSGIVIDALNGFPGTFSAYAEKKLGNSGILKLMKGAENRTARYISAVAFFDGKILKTFVGTVEGEISDEERGSGGFGYDPVFIPAGYKETFGENPGPKNEISHRRKSIEEFCKFYVKFKEYQEE
ncbi:MAG: non-canonical purine NTP pyrophosphatase, RdgB/HAM1 family [Candidatus Altiarchaeales archaeon A3]|nr:MAG: non-canonical purine NTP pyrophosphatase, RdgB/HAM1 family [Candidatus Altiarchaeales archaeon A3]